MKNDKKQTTTTNIWGKKNFNIEAEVSIEVYDALWKIHREKSLTFGQIINCLVEENLTDYGQREPDSLSFAKRHETFLSKKDITLSEIVTDSHIPF